MSLQPVRPDAVLPGFYSSTMDPAGKIAVALRAAGLVAAMDLHPVATTVTGSLLRGLDRPGSDIDALVLVSEKARTHRERLMLKHAVTTLKRHDIDAQVRPFDELIRIGSTSVPYVEAWRSPFLVADPGAAALLRAWVPDLWTFRAHAQRFALHVAAKESRSDVVGQTLDKRARNVMVARHLLEVGSPLCDREATRPSTDLARRSAEWLLECARITSAHHDPGNIHTVVRHLRRDDT